MSVSVKKDGSECDFLTGIYDFSDGSKCLSNRSMNISRPRKNNPVTNIQKSSTGMSAELPKKNFMTLVKTGVIFFTAVTHKVTAQAGISIDTTASDSITVQHFFREIKCRTEQIISDARIPHK